jgi:hypothetical protein
MDGDLGSFEKRTKKESEADCRRSVGPSTERERARTKDDGEEEDVK